MALKTGKDCLDNNDLSMADKSFVVGIECYMKLLKLVDSCEKDVHLTTQQMDECHQNMLRIYAFRAEVVSTSPVHVTFSKKKDTLQDVDVKNQALAQSQHTTALEFFNKANDLFEKCPTLRSLLCNISYNFGMDCHQKELFSQSADWLRTSIEVGTKNSEWESGHKTSTYQLITLVLLVLGENENLQNALQYIEIAIQTTFSMKNVLLKLKVMLQLEKEKDELLKVFTDACLVPLSDFDIAIQCVSLFAEKKQLPLSYDCLQVLCKKDLNNEQKIKLQIKKLQLLLNEDKRDMAHDLIKQELLSASDNGIVFEQKIMKQLQLLLWEQAQKDFEDKDFIKALQWYNYSVTFMIQYNDNPLNIAKLQRNRCCCLIELQNYDEALQAAEEAEKNVKDSPQILFYLFKIHLINKENDKASEALIRLSQLELEQDGKDDEIHNLVCLAAQLAFEHENKDLSQLALEKIINHVTEPKLALVSLRCLTRLKFTNLSKNSEQSELNAVVELLRKAYKTVENLENEKSTSFQDEILWFNKIAWNLALSCVKLPQEMLQSFMLCYQFSLLLPSDVTNLSQQKSCLLMAAGSGLEAARNKNTDHERIALLEETLNIIKKCYSVYESIKAEKPDYEDSMLRYLLSYEFEVKVRLNHADIDVLFDKAMKLCSGGSEALENFAGIALSISSISEIALKALKLCIKSMLDENKKDHVSLSKCIHSLISISIQKGSLTNAESKEDAYNFYQDVIKILEDEQQGTFPEMELIWLMTKAWNCGIHLYSAHHHEAATKWCSLSLKFLKYLGDLKSNYEPHMSTVFTDIQSRIQRSDVQMQVEE